MASATTSVSGLVSGLDTSTIISQLMQLEAQPQTALIDPSGATTKAYRAMALPTVFVLDKGGTVRDVMVGYSTPGLSRLETLVERLIHVVLADLSASFDPLCPVTFRFEDTSVEEVAALLAKLGGAPITFDDKADPLKSLPVTFSGTDMKLRAALDWLGRVSDITYVPTAEGITLTWKK